MKNLLNRIKNLVKNEENQKKDMICALRLSYNNFDEKLTPGKADYYSECLAIR